MAVISYAVLPLGVFRNTPTDSCGEPVQVICNFAGFLNPPSPSARRRGRSSVILLIEQIAGETGIKVGGALHSDALSGDGPASTYIGMMRDNVAKIKGAILGS